MMIHLLSETDSGCALLALSNRHYQRKVSKKPAGCAGDSQLEGVGLS